MATQEKIYVENVMLEKFLKSILSTDKRIVLLDDTPKNVEANQIIAKDIGTRFEFYKPDSALTNVNKDSTEHMTKIGVLKDDDLGALGESLSGKIDQMVKDSLANTDFVKKDASNIADLSKDNKFSWVKNLGLVTENRVKIGYNMDSASETNNFNIAVGGDVDNRYSVDSIIIGRFARAYGSGGIAIGVWWRNENNYNTETGRDDLTIGPACSTKNARASTALGAYMQIKGETNHVVGGGKYGDYIRVEGKDNLVFGYNFIMASGNIESTASSSYKEIHYDNNTYPQRNMVMGNNNRITDTNDNIIIGNATNINAKGPTNVLVLGGHTNPTVSNSIYLGSDVAATSETNTKTVGLGNANLSLGGHTTNFAGTTSADGGLLTIGKPGRERIIQNVAPGLLGLSSTDAVNGSQLYTVISEIGNLIKDISVENGQLKVTKYDGSTSNVDISSILGNRGHASVDDILKKLAGETVDESKVDPPSSSSSGSSATNTVIASVKETFSD